MTKPKLIILAWLLLLVPTLLLGVGALQLLQREQTRLHSSALAAATDRVGAVAANIDLAVSEVEEGLQETLSQLPVNNLSSQLDSWQRENPLVRNVFIWKRGHGLTFPNPEQPASDEEAAFVRRYLHLFADQSIWQEQQRDQQAKKQTSAQAVSRNVFNNRNELRLLSKQAPSVISQSSQYDLLSSTLEEDAIAPATSTPGQSGWRSWYTDDQLHLLGWFAPTDGELRYGIEIEMMALLSRLLGNLPIQSSNNESYALLDGNGDIFHQVGSFEILPNTTPLAKITLASLPHWQVAAYTQKNSDQSRGFLLIGTMLIGTFILAILLGGSLLLWQAYRNHRDAAQKTSFVSNVSHELKTPLTTIRMYAELLGEGKISDTDKQGRYLQTIIRESQRLTRLVSNVLDFSRLEQGRCNYQKQNLNLNLLLQQLSEQLQPRLASAGMDLQINLPDPPLELYSDIDALEQIILNLIDNCIKYAASGKQLQLVLESHKSTVKLRLRDWGPGIPSGQRQKIFTKFHRIDNTLTTKQQGSGLGLSIARQLAQGLGGSLEYYPVSGNGCCIELTLPETEGA